MVESHAEELLCSLREDIDEESSQLNGNLPIIPLILNLSIPAPEDATSQTDSLKLEVTVAFGYEGHQPPQDPPEIKIRIHQPPWMSKAASMQVMSQIPVGEDIPGTIEYIKEAASNLREQSRKPSLFTACHDDADIVRVWFYFPSISTRSKRDDFIKHAPFYNLTGFLYAGKPGLLCVEGQSQKIDDYMKFIKTESWGDIPAHHKKVSERYRSSCDQRVFPDMTEITDMVGDRQGQRANRGDMKAIEDWLKERDLGDAFAKVLM